MLFRQESEGRQWETKWPSADGILELAMLHILTPTGVHLEHASHPADPPHGLDPPQVHLKHHTLATPTAKATLYHTIWEQLLEILFPTLATQV